MDISLVVLMVLTLPRIYNFPITLSVPSLNTFLPGSSLPYTTHSYARACYHGSPRANLIYSIARFTELTDVQLVLYSLSNQQLYNVIPFALARHFLQKQYTQTTRSNDEMNNYVYV